MKIISKIIVRLLSLVALFIIANLVIWVFKYGWLSNYVDILDEKNREDSIAQVQINNPKTWLSIFYGEDTWEDLQTSTTTTSKTTKTTNSTNPYDTDYEDEFNSFFAWE